MFGSEWTITIFDCLISFQDIVLIILHYMMDLFLSHVAENSFELTVTYQVIVLVSMEGCLNICTQGVWYTKKVMFVPSHAV